MYHLKYGVEFFVKTIGLVYGQYMYRQIWYPQETVDDFPASRPESKWRGDAKTNRFFACARAR